MPYNLSISLSNWEYVYEPGQELDGFVSFELKETIKVKAIKVSAEGVATTKWLLSESSKSSHGRSREVSYSAKVNYLNEEQVVWKPSEGHAKSSIFPGIHVFPFKFVIPKNIPPSFEGDHGSIRYLVRVTVERPWKTNRTLLKYLYVNPPKNLNLLQNIGDVTSDYKSKKVGFFLFRLGRVILNIRIPKKGYVGGETICAEMDIDNQSSQPILKAECYLVQQCRYLAYRYGMGGNSMGSSEEEDRDLSRKKDETRIATCIQELNLAPRSSYTSKVRLTIPCCCPNFDSSLIHVEYFIGIKLHVKCRFRNSVKAECPIIVGNVPIQDESIDPRTPTFGEVTVFSQLTQRSIMSVDEKITPKYVYYPKFGKSRDLDKPPSLDGLQLPPIDDEEDDF